ncbi:MAG TPA: hypothetical protein VGI57_13535, partial [Usitatibacter sp.]
LVPAAFALGCTVLLIEMAYNASDESNEALRMLGHAIDTKATGTWIAAVSATLAAYAACGFAWHHVSTRWAEIGSALAGDRRR